MKVLVLAVILLLLMPVKIQFGNAKTNASAYDEKLVAFEESLFTARKKSIECMALNIYHEARSLSTAGQLAVAQVTLNRVQSQKYPNTICEVVYQGKHWVAKDGTKYPRKNLCQFSWYCDGLNDKPQNQRMYDRSIELATQVVDGKWPDDITDGAMYYYADYIDPPRWTKGKIRAATIDVHRFYRYKR